LTVPLKPEGDNGVTAHDAAGTILVLTTLPSSEEARRLVQRLVADRLVACGTVVEGVMSVYRWEGKVESATEAQVILKTQRSRWEDLKSAIEQLHPYDVPELLALPIESGLQAYLDWVGSETTDQ
jgi:periplasmic divalent cation tolerance protein